MVNLYLMNLKVKSFTRLICAGLLITFTVGCIDVTTVKADTKLSQNKISRVSLHKKQALNAANKSVKRTIARETAMVRVHKTKHSTRVRAQSIKLAKSSVATSTKAIKGIKGQSTDIKSTRRAFTDVLTTAKTPTIGHLKVARTAMANLEDSKVSRSMTKSYEKSLIKLVALKTNRSQKYVKRMSQPLTKSQSLAGQTVTTTTENAVASTGRTTTTKKATPKTLAAKRAAAKRAAAKRAAANKSATFKVSKPDKRTAADKAVAKKAAKEGWGTGKDLSNGGAGRDNPNGELNGQWQS